MTFDPDWNHIAEDGIERGGYVGLRRGEATEALRAPFSGHADYTPPPLTKIPPIHFYPGAQPCACAGNCDNGPDCKGWVLGRDGKVVTICANQRIFTPSPPANDNQRTIIAFTGLAGSGKSTAAAHLVEHHGYERVRFAGPLKSMVAALGLSHDEIEGGLKEQPCALLGGKTPRFAMQRLGTEFGREMIDPDLWIRAWQAAMAKVPAGVPVVVDDCRFLNEAEAVQRAGGVLVRIVRPGAGAGAAGHSSEGQDLPFVATLANERDAQALLRQVDCFVSDLSWTDRRAG